MKKSRALEPQTKSNSIEKFVFIYDKISKVNDFADNSIDDTNRTPTEWEHDGCIK